MEAIKSKKAVAFSFITKIKEKAVAFSQRPFLFFIVLSLLLEFIIEVLSRHSLIKGVLFVFQNPVAFAFGATILAITFLPVLFVKRKLALGTMVFVLWLAMGVTNSIVLLYRITPFSAMDISLMPSVFSIFEVYMTWWQVAPIILLIVGALALIVYMFIKAPKAKYKLKSSLLASCYILICFALTLFSSTQSGAINGKFTNLGDAYRDYGFTYCFTASIFSRGIARPADYSKEVMNEIESQVKDGTGEGTASSTVKDPNIIFVQLESFFDVNYLKGVKYSQNPVENFTKLKDKYSSGFLTVPSIGAGTANTEFEILTGMNKEYFGIGEYPYKTILQNTQCESICYNLKENSYSCHAIHNHYGKFYDRDIVFRNLGFDTFTPVEYMTNVGQTIQGWEKDDVLPRYIDTALNSTKGRDFIFAISVQGHGKYPTEYPEDYTPAIKITDGMEDPYLRTQYEFYINMMYDTDKIIGELVDMYSDSTEPVMIVFYGDHLPNLELAESQLTDGNLLQTEYVIWTNYTQKVTDLDLNSYQLSSRVMSLCENSNGIINKIHMMYANNNYADDESYQYMLSRVEYDMLYGDSYLVGSYQPVEQLKLGINDITIKNVSVKTDEESDSATTVISGEGFNPWSVVYINGNSTRTVYKDEKVLIIEGVTLNPGDIITVSQVSKEAAVLSTTKEYVYQQ